MKPLSGTSLSLRKLSLNTFLCRMGRPLWLLPLLFASATQAIDLQSVSLGARYGEVLNLSGGRLDAERADVFIAVSLPWEGDWDKKWKWDTGMELTLGTYSGDTHANVAALGPVIMAGKEGSRFSFEAGIQLTHLTESVLGDRDIGGQTHFTSLSRYFLIPLSIGSSVTASST